MDDEPQAEADVEGEEADADADYDAAEEEGLYAGPHGNFRGRGWRRGRSRYGSRFGRRGFGPRQAYAYPQGAVNQEPLRGQTRKALPHKRRLPLPPQDPPTISNKALE